METINAGVEGFSTFLIMNTKILEQYKLVFRITKDNQASRMAKVDSLSNPDSIQVSPLVSLFTNGYKTGHLAAIIETIQQAEDGLPFDPEEDGGPLFASLEIGITEITIKEHTRGPQFITTIPTADLKEIILSWFEFLEQNNLENNVF